MRIMVFDDSPIASSVPLGLSFMDAAFRLLLPGACALLAAGCIDMKHGLGKQERAVAEQISKEILRIENLRDESLGWDQALELMKSSNLEIVASMNQVRTAEESVTRLYREFIPGAGISAGVNKAITEYASLGANDFALTVFTFVNVPGLINYRIRYYASTLELARARWAYELKLRELTIALHEQFLQFHLHEERAGNLALSERFQDFTSAFAGLDATPESLRKEELALTLQRQNRGMQANISRLLGSTRSRWILDARSLPEWDYLNSPLEINNPEEFGLLYRQLQALQLEGLRLSKLGVKFQYWPDINISISSPPVFAVQDGRSRGFDLDQALVSLNTSMRLDTNASIWTQLDQIERRISLDKKRLEQANAILIEELMTNQNALELNSKQRKLNEIRLKFMNNQQRSLDPLRNRDHMENSLALSERRSSLLIERAQLQATFWLLDERRWDRIDWEAPEEKMTKP